MITLDQLSKLDSYDLSLQLSLPLEWQALKPVSVDVLDVKKRLQSVLKRDLTFNGEKTDYATHGLHAFAAKFPPPLPRLLIRELTRPGDLILDPMVGSGTTLVEAVLADRRAIGFDLDPLSVLISHIKSNPIDRIRYAQAGVTVWQEAKRSCESSFVNVVDYLNANYSLAARAFFDYWFEPHTIRELCALMQAIRCLPDASSRMFLQVVFSAIIITKSGQLTRARDLAHSRPHRDLKRQVTLNALQVFKDRLDETIHLLASLEHSQRSGMIVQTDARQLPVSTNSIDCIITSPPYAANAIDYMRAHKFSLIWFGHDLQALSALRRQYIGSEQHAAQLEFGSETANRVLRDLQRIDKKRAGVVAHYFTEMEVTLREMLRVLKPSHAAILVVGSSILRGIDIETPTVLTELGQAVGFSLVDVARRQITRNARMMPISHQSERAGIEARMHEEGVIGLIKPSKEQADATTS